MSEENVDTLRQMYERWAEGDLTAGAPDLDPEVLFVIRPPFMQAGTYVGPDQVRHYMGELVAEWDRYTIELKDLRSAGDTILASIRQHGIGRSSGAETKLDSFMVFTFRAGKIIRIDNLVDEVEALEAAGLSEPGPGALG